MPGYLLRRVGVGVLLLILVSSAALWLTRLAPGDFTTEVALTASPEEIARARARFGLDQSPAAQWVDWLSRVVRLDFGDSSLYERPVGGLVARSAANTAVLATVALVLATIVGLPLGIVTGAGGGGPLPLVIRAVSLVSLSVPPLVTSLVLVWLASRTGWLPVGGMHTIGAAELGWGAWLVDLAWHLPLPVCALALPIAGTLERLQSQSIRDVIREPFVHAALARGLSRPQMILAHAWRSSLRPVCGLYGIVIGTLFSGSFAVEFVTAWPGLGRLMFEALRARDVYLVSGCVAAGALFLMIGSLVSDVLLAAVDPRVSRARAGVP